MRKDRLPPEFLPIRCLLKHRYSIDQWESVEGDLLEIFLDEKERSGRLVALVRLWKEGLSLAVKRPVTPVTIKSPAELAGSLAKALIFSVRRLTRRPGLSLTVIVALATALGVAAAIFSMFNAIFLKPLAVAEPHQLVRLFAFDPTSADYPDVFSYPTIQDLDRESELFQGIAARSLERAAFQLGNRTEMLYGEVVSHNFFEVLRPRFALGSGFSTPTEGRQPQAPSVVISHRVWTDLFGGRRDIVGEMVRINNTPSQVVGITESEFAGTKALLSVDFWLPVQDAVSLVGNRLNQRDSHWLQAIGRLKSGVSLAQAEEEVNRLLSNLKQAYPGSQGRERATLRPARGLELDAPPNLAGPAKTGALVAQAAVALVLLTVCFNVANLMLARATLQRHETAVQLALGAGRSRLAVESLMESLILATAGGVLGLWAGYGLARSAAFLFPAIPYRLNWDVVPDWRIITFMTIASLASGLLFGLIPLSQIRISSIMDALRSRRTTTSRKRMGLRKALVVGQVAFGVSLLFLSGLFVRSLIEARSIDPGFSFKNLIFAEIEMGLSDLDAGQRLTFLQNLEAELAGLAVTESVAFATNPPLDDSQSTVRIWPEGGEVQPEEGLRSHYNAVGADFFGTLQIPILEGRGFQESDREGESVCIVSRQLASRLWPGVSPTGRRISFEGSEGPFIRVIGVAGDILQESLGAEQKDAVVYRPIAQVGPEFVRMIIRSTTDQKRLELPLSRTVNSLNPDVAVFNLQTSEEYRSYSLWVSRLGATLASVFGLLALVVAMVGLYGVISYLVAERTHEIGIRMAMGAERRDVVRMVLWEGSKLAVVGLALGLGLSLAAGTVVASLLYGVSGVDPLSLMGVIVLILVVALMASFVPAWRAATVSPVRALRRGE